jgi:hypothetical protein
MVKFTIESESPQIPTTRFNPSFVVELDMIDGLNVY